MTAEELLARLEDAVIVADADGYIVYTNAAANRLTGYTTAELAGKPLAMLYKEADDGIRVNYELEQARKMNTMLSESWRKRKDGSVYWGVLQIRYWPAEKAQDMKFVCMLHDGTVKKWDEIALRKSEERYRLMVANVKDYAIFLLDAKGIIMTWNDGAQEIKGYSAKEIIGNHFSIFYTADDKAKQKPARELIIAEDTGKYEEEGWRVRKNGSVFWASIVLTALYDDQNRIIGFSKVTRDLSEKKSSEEALRQSEERYRLLVEQVVDYGIFMLDDKGRVVSWNEGARRISGYETAQILGKSFSIFYPEEDIMNGKPALELKVARTHGKYEEEGWRLRSDGRRFWANVVITAVYNSANVLLGYSKVTRDLTERKNAERALKESNEQYRRLWEDLRHMNQHLAAANRELEQFTSVASHDLQEPVRTLQSYLQLIGRNVQENKTDIAIRYIEKAAGTAIRMRELIRNLLQYSQMGKTKGSNTTVDIAETVGIVLQNLKNAIELSGAVVHTDFKVNVLQADPHQMVQLFQNLLSNALKFTNGHQPIVEIKCSNIGGEVVCSVADNGIGIASDDLDKVFEIFKRLNTDRDYPGTGIGLAICKKIVDSHGGRIWVESVPGRGTTFFFTIVNSAQK